MKIVNFIWYILILKINRNQFSFLRRSTRLVCLYILLWQWSKNFFQWDCTEAVYCVIKMIYANTKSADELIFNMKWIKRKTDSNFWINVNVFHMTNTTTFLFKSTSFTSFFAFIHHSYFLSFGIRRYIQEAYFLSYLTMELCISILHGENQKYHEISGYIYLYREKSFGLLWN